MKVYVVTEGEYSDYSIVKVFLDKEKAEKFAYWWSNIAIAEVKNSRVVVPCQSVFANWYSGGSHALAKLSMPDGEGFDASYPEKFDYVKDHF